MVATRGRPREVDPPPPSGPHATGSYDGWVGLGHIRANGHPSGGRWRPCHGLRCQGYCLETQGTPRHGQHVPPERLVWAVGAWAERLGIRAVARGFEVDPNTVVARDTRHGGRIDHARLDMAGGAAVPCAAVAVAAGTGTVSSSVGEGSWDGAGSVCPYAGRRAAPGPASVVGEIIAERCTAQWCLRRDPFQ
jgi:hypothetical protein